MHALQARNELEAVLHAPNQTGTATRTAWSEAVERCLRPQTPIAKALCTFRQWCTCCGAIAALLEDVPMGWRHGAAFTPETRAGMVPSVESVTAALVERLGWRWNGGPIIIIIVVVTPNSFLKYDYY